MATNNKLKQEDAEIAPKKLKSETTNTPVKDATETKAVTAKAGKRSAKAIAEKQQQIVKQQKKLSSQDSLPEKTKPRATKPRSERRSKQYKQVASLVEANKAYALEEAIILAKKTSFVKFDATVEIHVNLAVDPKHADQNVRDNLMLPHGSGKVLKIAALSAEEAVAKEAGADLYKLDDIFNDLDKGVINFDILIASPDIMPRLGKYAKTLGPRGLMPNPKSGTVSNNVAKAIAEAKAGRVEYRVDSTGIIHLGIGKVSFSETNLKANIEAVISSLKSNKPSSIKGEYIKAVHLSTSMGPSIKAVYQVFLKPWLL